MSVRRVVRRSIHQVLGGVGGVGGGGVVVVGVFRGVFRGVFFLMMGAKERKGGRGRRTMNAAGEVSTMRQHTCAVQVSTQRFNSAQHLTCYLCHFMLTC